MTGWIRAAAAREGSVAVLLVNYNIERSQDRIAELRFSGLRAGHKRLTIYRIDDEQRWSNETLELRPVEQRDRYAPAAFRCQLCAPADTVALLKLQDIDAP